MSSDLSQKVGKLIVTCRAPFTARKTRAALRKAVFPARITRPDFRSIFVVEAEGEAIELAKQVYVNLNDPDVTVNAEVLGHITVLGILRKDWQIAAQTEALQLTQPHSEVPELPTRKLAGPLVSVEPEAKRT